MCKRQELLVGRNQRTNLTRLYKQNSVALLWLNFSNCTCDLVERNKGLVVISWNGGLPCAVLFQLYNVKNVNCCLFRILHVPFFGTDLTRKRL